MFHDGMYDNRSDDSFEELSAPRERLAYSGVSIPQELVDLSLAVERRRSQPFDPLIPLLLVQTVYDRDDVFSMFAENMFAPKYIFTPKLRRIYERGEMYASERQRANQLASYFLSAHVVEGSYALCHRLNEIREVVHKVHFESLMNFGDMFFMLDQNVIDPMMNNCTVESTQRAFGHLSRMSSEMKVRTLPRICDEREGADYETYEFLHGIISLVELCIRDCDRVIEQLKFILAGSSERGQVVHRDGVFFFESSRDAM